MAIVNIANRARRLAVSMARDRCFVAYFFYQYSLAGANKKGEGRFKCGLFFMRIFNSINI